MPDPQDIIDIPGLSTPRQPPTTVSPAAAQSSMTARNAEANPWLSVWFRCCHTYGRIYRNRARTAYEGGCPRCAARVRAEIGPGGTAARMFQAE